MSGFPFSVKRFSNSAYYRGCKTFTFTSRGYLGLVEGYKMTTDEQLLNRIEFKDRRAMELVFDRYYLLLWRICWKAQADSFICERLITQVFQQLWNQPQEFSGEKRFILLLVTCCEEKMAELKIKRNLPF